MGEHQTWLDFVDDKWSLSIRHGMHRDWTWMMFQNTHVTLVHVAFSLIVISFVIYGAMRFYSATRGTGQAAIVPPPRVNIRNFFEMICDTTLSLMEGVMGHKAAKRFFPLIASLAFFIFFSNILALIPGMGVPTTTLKTNVALAMIVFFATHIYGVKEHGLAYFKHFAGPIPLLAPLMIPIEIISHLVRPASLSIRLMGNMAGDHKVVFSFFTLVPLLVPVPFLFLGTLVATIQTLVFCLLSMVYIGMAIEHDH